jgi:hypothetical protein
MEIAPVLLGGKAQFDFWHFLPKITLIEYKNN